MSEDFIDELRNAFDKGAVLSGGDIDARYHHDLAGNPVPNHARSSARERRRMSRCCCGSVIAKASPLRRKAA
jgi:hypothetical protein